jgi:hypothetical protein
LNQINANPQVIAQTGCLIKKDKLNEPVDGNHTWQPVVLRPTGDGSSVFHNQPATQYPSLNLVSQLKSDEFPEC